MKRRYLIGPVSGRFAADHLSTLRTTGACLTFGGDGTDISFAPGESLAELTSRLPSDWRPDAILLHLGYTVLPTGFSHATVPLIGYAPDWQLHWHYYRKLASHFDCLWMDFQGAELFRSSGIANVRAIIPFGRPVENFPTAVAMERDIDLLWVGNFNPVIHRERHRWVKRVAKLGENHRVFIASTLDPVRYRPLLRRSRTAFLPTFHGGWDGLVPEAMAAGAVVFRDADLGRGTGPLQVDRDYLAFDDENLETVIESLLHDEPRRQAMATEISVRTAEFSTPSMWSKAEALLDDEWDKLATAAMLRQSAAANKEDWELQHWQHLTSWKWFPSGSFCPADSSAELALAIRNAWRKDRVENCIDVLRTLSTRADIGFAASLHLAEILAGQGSSDEAIRLISALQEQLANAETLPSEVFGFGSLTPGFNPFRVEWERTGFTHANDHHAEMHAKRQLLRGRCEWLLGKLSRDPLRIGQAATIAPELTSIVKAAAVALAKSGSAADALRCFERASSADPFDAKLTLELESLLKKQGAGADLDRVGRQQELLKKAMSDPVASTSAKQRPATALKRQRVTLTMIVRNEEVNLAACLDSVRDLVDQIVVVDTGSTDRTMEIAVQSGAQVVQFPWCDDFAAARNRAIEAAHGEWILWLDADERLNPTNRMKARHLFEGLRNENVAYLFAPVVSIARPIGIDNRGGSSSFIQKSARRSLGIPHPRADPIVRSPHGCAGPYNRDCYRSSRIRRPGIAES